MRDPDLQRFIDVLEDAVMNSLEEQSDLSGFAARVFDLTRQDTGEPAPSIDAGPLPVCRHLAPALVTAATGTKATAAVSDAFSHLAPKLAWQRRPEGPNDPAGFAENHANTTLVGVDGIERRSDIRIGASLLAPLTVYPDHSHPPEEMYLVLSEGDWRNADVGWRTPGIGGLVHNPPGIVHAMRSGDAPLFAVWCLLTG